MSLETMKVLAKKFLVVLLLAYPFSTHAQKQYKIRTIAFYNVENLFDTTNDSLLFDDDRTPEGRDRWTTERYTKKLDNISDVIAQIGSETTQSAPDLIGLCEVENYEVLADLIHHPNLILHDYGILHFDSPDERGIDVALLYKKSAFIPSSFKSHRLLLFNEQGERDYTRDQLVVGGFLDDEEWHIIVNHWPSRSGGEAKSKPFRLAAAQLNRRILDSIFSINPAAKIVSMGDFNDDPIDGSFKNVLKTVSNKRLLEEGVLFNPMEVLHKKGFGSLAYRDSWNLFDQIIFTANFVNKNKKTYSFWKAGIYNPSFLITSRGPYKGYPFRTYAGGNYTGGYSDHFPVYVFFIKEVE